MAVRFHIQDGTIIEVDCFQGLNLLAHAQMEELETGSECGGHGKCGKDRVKVGSNDQKKLNPPTRIEIIHLGQQKIDQGFRLACQAFPNQDGLEMDVFLGAGAIHQRD